MLDEAVRDAESLNAAGIEAHFAGGFEHRAAKAAHQAAFFECDHETAFAKRSFDHLSIDRLGKAGVDDADIQAVASEQVGRFVGFAEESAEAKDDAIGSPAKNLGATR